MENQQLSDVQLQFEYSPTISRWFIFRFLWMYLEMFVIMFWGIFVGFLNFFHVLYMLVMGRRIEFIWNQNARLVRTLTKWNSYISALTDKRPKFIED